MSYIYKTANGTAQKFNKETWAFRQSADATANLEGFVAAGILIRKDVLDTTAEIGEDAYAHAEMTLDTSTGKYMLATNATVTPAGSLSDGNVKANTVGATVSTGVTINKAGNSALPSGSDLVIGAGGRIALSQASLVSLASAVVGAASADIPQTELDGTTKVKVDTSVDHASARGVNVTLYVINDKDQVVKEVVTLSATDSSTDVSSVTKVKKLLAYSVDASITAVDLRVKSFAGNAIVTTTAPVSGTLYGSIAPDDSTDPLGQSVRILAATAPVDESWIVVKGTDDNSAEQLELIATDGVATTYKTKKQFKSITHLLVGADGVATNTYTISVLANLAGQKIGTNVSAVAANMPFELTRA